MSVDNWFQRKGAVNVNDLLVIRREEGLDGRIRETAEEDLVLAFLQRKDFASTKVDLTVVQNK